MPGFENFGIGELGGGAAIIYALGFFLKQLAGFIQGLKVNKGQLERREKKDFCCPLEKINPDYNLKEWHAFKKEFHEFINSLDCKKED